MTASWHGLADRRRRDCLLAGAASLVPGGFGAVAAPAPVTDWWAAWRQGRLRGFTTANVPDLDLATLQALQRTGANLLRLGLHFRRGPTGYALAEADARALQSLLQHAAGLRLGVVVLGLFDDGVTPQPLWRDPGLRASFVQAWGDFATRFGQHPALAGMDLFNEPHLPHLDHAAGQQDWLQLAGAALAAIRRAGSPLPAVLEPGFGGSAWGLRGFSPLADDRVVYSAHFYSPHEITHQRVLSQYPRQIPYPAGLSWQLGGWDGELGITAIDRARLALDLRHARQFAIRHGVPIYMGEFSCVRWAPGGSALRYIGDCLDLFEAAGWNWSFHSFRTWTGWDAEVDSENPELQGRSEDAPVMRRLRESFAALAAAARARAPRGSG